MPGRRIPGSNETSEKWMISREHSHISVPLLTHTGSWGHSHFICSLENSFILRWEKHTRDSPARRHHCRSGRIAWGCSLGGFCSNCRPRVSQMMDTWRSSHGSLPCSPQSSPWPHSSELKWTQQSGANVRFYCCKCAANLNISIR